MSPLSCLLRWGAFSIDALSYGCAETVLLPHDYLNFWLTGNAVMEYGDASGTALLNVRTRKWSKKTLKAIDAGLEAKLP